MPSASRVNIDLITLVSSLRSSAPPPHLQERVWIFLFWNDRSLSTQASLTSLLSLLTHQLYFPSQLCEPLWVLLMFHPVPVSSSLNSFLAYLVTTLSCHFCGAILTFLSLPPQSSPCSSNIPELLHADGYLGTCVSAEEGLPSSFLESGVDFSVSAS